MDLLATLNLFLDVTRSGSFSATGKHFGLSASAVNRRIKALEDELGVLLIQRSTRRHRLTEAGSRYAEQVQRVLTDLEAANALAGGVDGAPRGVLRITAPVAFGRLHVSPMLSDFMREYEALEVELILTDRHVDLIGEPVDLAIRIAELPDSSLRMRRLLAMERVVCASPHYLARHAPPNAPVDLAHHECITFCAESGTSALTGADKTWTFEANSVTQSVAVRGRLRTNNADVLAHALKSGQGLGLVPAWLVLDELESGALEAVLADHTAAPMHLDSAVYALYASARHLSPGVRAFLDFASDHFEVLGSRIDAARRNAATASQR